METMDDDKHEDYRVLPIDAALAATSGISSGSFAEHDELFRSCPSVLGFDTNSNPQNKSFPATHDIFSDKIHRDIYTNVTLKGQSKSLSLSKRDHLSKRRLISLEFLCSKTVKTSSVLDRVDNIQKICYEELLPQMKHSIGSDYKKYTPVSNIDTFL